MSTRIKSVVLVLALGLASGLARGDETDGRIAALEKQIQALQARVAALEAARSFTSFMPNFAERFHVMHRAGEAGDWAVASHELEEMKRLTRLSVDIDAEKGKLMQGMLVPSFELLEDAIAHGNAKKFGTALVQTIDSCNACHAATGSGFIRVMLDDEEALSMRHPHHLTKQPMPEGHSHAMPAVSKKMHGGPAGKFHHDDTGKPEHTH